MYYIEATSCLLVIFISLLVFLIDKSNKKYLKNVPGPKGVFLFGNLYDNLIPIADLIPRTTRYYKMYGPIFKIIYGPFRQFIFVSDYKLIEYTLSSYKFTEKGHDYQCFTNWLGKGLLTESGAVHKKQKKLLSPYLHLSQLVKFIEKFESASDVLVDNLMIEVGKPSVDIYPIIALFAFEAVFEIVLGSSVTAQQVKGCQYIDCVKILSDIMPQRIVSPLHHRLYFLTPTYYKEKRTLNKLNSQTDLIIDQRFESLKNETISGDTPKRQPVVLDLLLTTVDDDGKPMSRKSIREIINSIIFASFDTVASTLSFTLYTLATHPDVQKKAVNEQKEIFGDNKHSNINLSELEQMTYLDCVIKETLRLYPAGPIFLRNISEDFEWDGSLYPKNATLVICAFAIHRNPEYFEKPEEFIPERFENYDNKYPYSYIPFSAGPRKCIGQKFAMLELKTVLSKILRNFILSPSTPKHVLKLSPELVLASRNGVCISLEKRE